MTSKPNPNNTPLRDQEATGFTLLLNALMEALPEALCAVFIDPEGESVDYAGRINPYDARVTGAEFAVILATCREGATRGGMGHALELRAEGGSKSVLVRMVSEGYDLVVLLATPSIALKAVDKTHQCAMALLRESGLPAPPSFAKLKSGEGRHSSVAMAAVIPGKIPGIAGLCSNPDEPLILMDKHGAKIVAAVVGVAPGDLERRMLVRLEDGEEALIVFDAGSNRWKRAT